MKRVETIPKQGGKKGVKRQFEMSNLSMPQSHVHVATNSYLFVFELLANDIFNLPFIF